MLGFLFVLSIPAETKEKRKKNQKKKKKEYSGMLEYVCSLSFE